MNIIQFPFSALRRNHFVTSLIFFSFSITTYGQNLSNVFSPDVKPGSQAFEWRVGYNPDTERYATRAHYQYGFSESLRMRIISSLRGSDSEDLELRYWRLETQWQFREDQLHGGWDSAVRLEIQVAEGDNLPSRLRLGWTNKWRISDELEFRFIPMIARQIGPQSGNDYLLETRARLAYRLNEKTKLSFDLFSDFNTADSIGSFSEQEHQLGPLLQIDLNDDFTLNAGPLFGLTNISPDAEYRVHLIYGF